MKKIVVVGGGAGGMELVKKLGNKLGRTKQAEIILIDISNYHIWKPLLHELATGSLDEASDGIYYQVHGAQNGYRFEHGALSGLDKDNQQVIIAPLFNSQGEQVLAERRIDYDYLVLGIGAVSNDFGTPGVAEHAYTLDLIEQAMQLRERVQHLFMQSASGQHQGDLRISIVGAGATGVELAAELQHLALTLSHYDSRLDAEQLKLTLIEASDTVMPALPQDELRQMVYDKMMELGIDVRTNTMVTKLEASGLETKNGDFIEADLMVWAAGVKAPAVLATLDLEVNQANQIMVDDTGRSNSKSNIFAFGDCAAVPQPNGQFLPPRGQTARQMALLVGDNLISLIRNPNHAQMKHYLYKDLGSFVNMSRFKTVGNMFSHWGGGLQVAGMPARFVYASLYRRHLLAMHGPIKGSLLLFVNGVQSLLKPHLKLW